MVLIPDEVYDRCDEAELNELLAVRGGFTAKKLRMGKDYASDRRIVAGLAAAETKNAVMILAEAWMPPIAALLIFVQELRRALPEKTAIRIGLLGRPGPATIFTPVEPAAFSLWRQKTDALGDPYLLLEDLSGNP